jgi:squalene-hopene/tetraprenyl-beta-curcumene cyclase
MIDPQRFQRAYLQARQTLLHLRLPGGYWEGELSTSALSTAVAVCALAKVGGHDARVDAGIAWLAANQNDDGGWGDTIVSFSNISTTLLCLAAFHITGRADRFANSLARTRQWLAERYGNTPEQIAEAVRARYGKDRTFSVPILMTCALAGLVPWREVPPLPFELACFPQSWYRFLGLPVVSYALPALIAIGQAVHHHRGSWNPIRTAAIGPSLRVLAKIQPSNGGFLEATPLTSFVALGLASTGKIHHPVVCKCVDFIVASMREDGSWPIDTNLSTWVTTLAINALAAAKDLDALDRKEQLLAWLLDQQFRTRHPFTGADPGGWAWTPLPGGVPDADDTPGAILAVRHLTEATFDTQMEQVLRQLYGGVKFVDLCEGRRVSPAQPDALQGNPAYHALRGWWWLRGLQNRDGGWPTFCRGWGKLPFDRSGCDLTAHALRALQACRNPSVTARVLASVEQHLGLGPVAPTQQNTARLVERALTYLAREQRPDGSWLPLWFGNQHAPDDINPTYGTSRVLAAYRDLARMNMPEAQRGVAFLLSIQNADGGWGGAKDTPSSVEETALALDALLGLDGAREHPALARGLNWLMDAVEAGRLHDPTPIGFYFAKLWYFEKMYPIVWTVMALGRARNL